MLDQSFDCVLAGCVRLVGQAVSFEIECDRSKACSSERWHREAERVGTATPAVHQYDRRGILIAALYHANSGTRFETHETNAVGRIFTWKHLAGTERVAATGAAHRLKSIQFLCRGACR